MCLFAPSPEGKLSEIYLGENISYLNQNVITSSFSLRFIILKNVWIFGVIAKLPFRGWGQNTE
jgi:hypothetical protein